MPDVPLPAPIGGPCEGVDARATWCDFSEQEPSKLAPPASAGSYPAPLPQGKGEEDPGQSDLLPGSAERNARGTHAMASHDHLGQEHHGSSFFFKIALAMTVPATTIREEKAPPPDLGIAPRHNPTYSRGRSENWQ
jgi:hypothetical protein